MTATIGWNVNVMGSKPQRLPAGALRPATNEPGPWAVAFRAALARRDC